MDPAALDAALERGPLGEDGRSGAGLERLVLADGSRVVVKHYDPRSDLLMRMLGDDRGHEVALFRAGVLDRLPPLVRHPVIDAWYDDSGLGVVVMRDLGDSVLGWRDTVDTARATLMFAALAQLHRAHVGSPPAVQVPLSDVLGMFEVPRLRGLAGEELVDLALRGWSHWAEVVPGEVGAAVLDLAHDTTTLVEACRRLPATLLHGDLATVNMAFEADHPGCLTLFDWGTATAGPAEVDLGRLLAGCGHQFECGLEEVLALHRESVGAAYDEQAMSLGLLAGLVWLGWNKALDIVEHPAPHVRERERVNLGWWLRQAGAALESGVV